MAWRGCFSQNSCIVPGPCRPDTLTTGPDALTNPRKPGLCLASSSPRRREILTALGLRFSVQPVEVDEQPLAGETSEQMVVRLAVAKATAAGAAGKALVLGADTAVVVDGQVLGKPRGKADAVAMLAQLSGRTHRVVTGVALLGPAGAETTLGAADVRFRDIRQDEALAYWHSGEPRDKAGAYAIQGLGGVFVEAIEGSYSAVVGLPVFETAKLLSNRGIDVIAKQA
ncbi:MAG: septum formation inhibitor Maf, partial [Woeseiaceae bacterium]|nr:septum formation inhibitor Maf [Woeseiaceae bacterium]